MDKPRKILNLKFLNIEKEGGKLGCFLILVAIFSIFLGLLFIQLTMPLILKTSKEIRIPDITGITLNQARTMLELEGLDMRISGEEYSETVPSGVVTSQNPLPNTSIKFNRIVEVIVSKGTEKVKIPFVKGLLVSNATDILLKVGIVISETTYVFDNNYVENVVIGTEPPANSYISKGGMVTLYVSKGKIENYVQIPNLNGLPSDSALIIVSKFLKHLNLKIDTLKGKKENLYVFKQFPDSGQYLRKGDTLKIILKGK